MKEIYISIILCCYNSQSFLIETLNSIKNQTYKKFELIIINDGSTDNTKKLIKEFINENSEIKVKFINQKNSGLSKSRNVAISFSKYDYIALLDHDDLWVDTKLEKQVNHIDKNKDCDLFLSDFYYLNGSQVEKTRFEVARNKDLYNPVKLNLNYINCFKELATKGCFIGTSSVIFNKNILNKENYFDTRYKFLTDYIFFLEVAKTKNFYCSDEILSYWRSHINQATSKMSKIHTYELNKLYIKFYFSNLLNLIDKFIIIKKHLKLLIKLVIY